MTTWTSAITRYWDESLSTQGKDFRVKESVLEQHALASEREAEFRVPYGVDGFAGWQLMNEIKRRREHGMSLVGLRWPPSDDPSAPANDPCHPYYLG